MNRSSRWSIILVVGLATVVADVALEPVVISISDQLLAPFFLLVVTGMIGVVLVALEPTGLRQPAGIGLVGGTVFAFLVLVVVIVLEIVALGGTGV